jgi:gluconate 2-dehydrogenase gamma chain
MPVSVVNRRDAIRRLAAGGVGAAALPAWVESLSAFAVDHADALHAQARKAAAAWKPKVLTPAQNAAVIALSEAIIPQTETAGAKAAKVNEFIDGALAGASAANREQFLAGLKWVDARVTQGATTDVGKGFAGATIAQQTALLTALSAPDALNGPEKVGAEFFRAIKAMTITGYYTSEIGMREELGDNGQMFFAEFKGCTHPEHQA